MSDPEPTPDADLPVAPGRREVRISYQGTSHNPHGTREVVLAALYQEATGQPAEEYLERPGETVEQALTAAAVPRRLVRLTQRLTYPATPCTCPAVDGPHLLTDQCPVPEPIQVEQTLAEETSDGGRTWRKIRS